MKKTLIANAKLVNEGKIISSDLLIEGERISKIAPFISNAHAKVIDFEGNYLLPGMIDDQVHFREPGLTHKATIFSESRAAVAGGITSFMDMPNTIPNTLTIDLLEEKYAIASKTSLANYSFFMGINQDNLEEALKIDNENVCGITDDGLYFNNDEGILGYGLNPPSIGVNFFEGPLNENGKQIGLTKFVYYDNNQSQQGNPSNPAHFWNYLNGRWKDGQSITYGGNGRGGSDTASYMFPGSTDPGKRAAWTEKIAGNTPADRRFLQTAGSFKLLPGAVNRVTIGVVWSRATTGGATGSFNLLKEASDKATVLFKNNFKILRGPEFDDNAVKITELNRELVINIINAEKPEAFKAKVSGLCTDSTDYKFQGYQIYQLKIPTTPSDFSDRDQARLVAQCDLQDGIGFIVNIVNDPDLGNVKKIMVNGEDKGIRHSFSVKNDLFAQGESRLVNFKRYYFMAVSYAYNNYKEYIPTDPLALDGQKKKYITSRKAAIGEVKVMEAVPHNPMPEAGGTAQMIAYGSSPLITRLDGYGNGNRSLELTAASEKTILEEGYMANPTYDYGRGPINIKVVDPLNLASGYFECKFNDYTANASGNAADTASWTVYRYANKGDLTPIDSVSSENTIAGDNEQIIPAWGISVQIYQNKYYFPVGTGSFVSKTTDMIESSIEFADSSKRWLTGVKDNDAFFPTNWIRSGDYTPVTDPTDAAYDCNPLAPNPAPVELNVPQLINILVVASVVLIPFKSIE